MSRTVSHTHNLELLSLGLQDCLVSPKADKRKYLLSCQELLYSVSTNFCKWQISKCFSLPKYHSSLLLGPELKYNQSFSFAWL